MDYRSPFTLFSRPDSYRLPFILFSLSDHRREKKFDDENDLKTDLVKLVGFYERGILSLPERWRQVIENNGAYIVENQLCFRS